MYAVITAETTYVGLSALDAADLAEALDGTVERLSW